MSIPSYMFDTMVFNRICDGELDISAFREKAQFYATHIQRDEINNTKDCNRRKELLEVFETVADNVVPTESTVWDVSAWDEAKWGEENGLYSPILNRLDKVKKKDNNVQDALIAETAIKNEFVLVTDDGNLCKVTKEFGGKCTDTKSLAYDLAKIRND